MGANWRGISALRAEASGLPGPDVDRLGKMRIEAEETCATIKPGFGKNLKLAFDAFKNDGLLGASLICGRVVGYVFNHLPGTDVGTKIDGSVKRGVIRKESDDVKRFNLGLAGSNEMFTLTDSTHSLILTR